MIYLINQDWPNTSNNHAGIKYLCNKLTEFYPDSFCSLTISNFNKFSSNLFLQKIYNVEAKLLFYATLFKLTRRLRKRVKDKDVIFLMEYMDMGFSMTSLARKMHNLGITVYAMVHLVPQKLDAIFKTPNILRKNVDCVDCLFTLGHSLTDYFVNRGIDVNKVITSFHYVDNYYLNPQPVRKHKLLKVIAMGNQMRNVSVLKEVVEANPTVSFIICEGVADLRSYFKYCSNVDLIPFVPENVLKEKMLEADISLNIMNDTIGSNVIVTSLAMGLAMICSDVGSIHDYCDKTNTIFCCNENVKSFSSAIAYLENNRDVLSKMQESASKKALAFSIEKFKSQLLSIQTSNIL